MTRDGDGDVERFVRRLPRPEPTSRGSRRPRRPRRPRPRRRRPRRSRSRVARLGPQAQLLGGGAALSKSACTRRSTSNTVASMPQSPLSSTRRSRSDGVTFPNLRAHAGKYTSRSHTMRFSRGRAPATPRRCRRAPPRWAAAAQLARHGLDHLVRLGNPELAERRQAHHGAAHELARRGSKPKKALALSALRLRPRRQMPIANKHALSGTSGTPGRVLVHNPESGHPRGTDTSPRPG